MINSLTNPIGPSQTSDTRHADTPLKSPEISKRQDPEKSFQSVFAGGTKPRSQPIDDRVQKRADDPANTTDDIETDPTTEDQNPSDVAAADPADVDETDAISIQDLPENTIDSSDLGTRDENFTLIPDTAENLNAQDDDIDPISGGAEVQDHAGLSIFQQHIEGTAGSDKSGAAPLSQPGVTAAQQQPVADAQPRNATAQNGLLNGLSPPINGAAHPPIAAAVGQGIPPENHTPAASLPQHPIGADATKTLSNSQQAAINPELAARASNGTVQPDVAAQTQHKNERDAPKTTGRLNQDAILTSQSAAQSPTAAQLQTPAQIAAPIQANALNGSKTLQDLSRDASNVRWVSEVGFTSDVVAVDTPATARALQSVMLQQPDLPRHVAAQIADAIRQGGPDRPVEIILNPAELGRVRISMSAADGAMIVNVTADRPETLDLMRRHIDMLAQEFQDLGYGTSEFAFGQNASDPHRNTDQTLHHAQADDPLLEDTPAVTQIPTIQTDRIDIRL